MIMAGGVAWSPRFTCVIPRREWVGWKDGRWQGPETSVREGRSEGLVARSIYWRFEMIGDTINVEELI